MSQSPSPDSASASLPRDSAPATNDLEAIRQLLFAGEKRQLDGLQQRIENPVLHAQDVSQVLPRAVALAAAKDEQLTVALTPAVESALKASVKRDPSTLVNAIFPIIGPAIRKSISEMFSALVQSLNQTLEQSFSAQGLKWRLEAARTGRSFGEVVLAHTLLFRVEQVFLIHQRTGLLLRHLCAPHIRAEDAGMVSAMLTAIQDFARDSFRAPAGETLHTLEIGELIVWVESSPFATLAALIRGQAPYEFRAVLQGALENIHREQGAALESFDGDASAFELAQPHLESCLRAQFAEPAKKQSSAKLLLLGGLAVALLAVWLGLVIRDRQRWAGYVQRLKTEPGIVVTESGRHRGRYFVAGLRDPLAANPTNLMGGFELKADKVVGRWEPYQALSPELVLKRAITLLQPPGGVTLRLRDSVLFADGVAPGGWIERLRTHALMVPGVQGLNDSSLAEETQPALANLQRLQRQIEQTTLLFDDGLRLKAEQDAALETLSARLNELYQDALRANRPARVTVVGHTDKTGTEAFNLRLSQQRAEEIVKILLARGVPAALLAPTGVGPREPRRADLPEQEEPKNRRVTFRVVLEETSARPAP